MANDPDKSSAKCASSSAQHNVASNSAAQERTLNTTSHSSRRRIRHQITHKLHDYRWFIIAAAWALTLILGYTGFARHFDELNIQKTFSDIFYLTLQLFVLESGPVPEPVTWQLEIARLLAPAVATITALTALAAVFHEQLQLFWLRIGKKPTIICGLGRKGLLLTGSLIDSGHKVVVIEKDEHNDFILQCRDMGAIVLRGDCTDRRMLKTAGASRARYIISVCGDDGANAEVGVHAHEIAGSRRRGRITCFVHIVEPELCRLLQEKEQVIEDDDSFRIEFFNVYDRGAQALLERFPAFTSAADNPRPLLVGLGSMGESFVMRAARDWLVVGNSVETVSDRAADDAAVREPAISARTHTNKESGERYTNNKVPRLKKIPLTILDRNATAKTKSLLIRCPYIHDAFDITHVEMELESPAFQEAGFLFDGQGRCGLTGMYICLDNDSLGLSAALTLHKRAAGAGCEAPIIVRMNRSHGLGSLLEGVDGETEAFRNMRAFGLLDMTSTADLLDGGTNEILACAIHNEYIHDQEKQGETAVTNPSMALWEELPEDLRESNRQQADHIGAKLKAVGCGFGHLTDGDALRFEFSGDEIETMAIMEHDRWVRERVRAGWKYAPGEKDIGKKTSPWLVPWDELPEDIREYDRVFVRSLPAFLFRVGFQVYRL